MITHGAQRLEELIAHFDAAEAVKPDSARALLGTGLTQRRLGALQEWRRRDGPRSFRTRYGAQRHLRRDPRVACRHGHHGRGPDSSRRRAAIALRLDRNCLSATLAQALLLTAGGRQESAGRLIQGALSQPIGPNGETIAAMMVRYGPNASSLPPKRR